MNNIIGKGIFSKFYFVFSWGFSFISASHLLYKKIYIPMTNEFNKLRFYTCSNLLYVK